MNKIKKQFNNASAGNKPALALVMALIVLVILASIVYALSARIATASHRRQYFIDYQKARYAADSAMKYALISFKKTNPKIIDRSNSPDFSDLFTLSRLEYRQLLEEWAQQQYEKALLEQLENGEQTEKTNEIESSLSSLFGLLGLDPNSPDDPFELSEEEDDLYVDPNDLEIPGPYGPKWPLITEPIEFNIDQTKITIEFEDENAKMPLTWAITSDKEVNRQAQAALQTFSEWMQMDESQIAELALQLDDIGEIKQFKLDPKDIVETKTTTRSAAARRTASRRTRTATTAKTTTTKKTLVRTAIHHTTDFAKLFHSSILNLNTLALPITDTGKRYEAPIKYLALWGSQRVNINTAPRHVLEAAFTFGGDAEEIANEIITLRKEKPIKDINDLKSRLYAYNDSIEKTKNYITTSSTFFSIKVTAQSGRAKTAAIATVVKEKNRFERVAIITQ
ncbi:MAG: general secretion pathway protein GspK [Sedimentisphaerales bacterium]|nr:general secretion pathway protein GspK [Sedimentisphaerales bacterium]